MQVASTATPSPDCDARKGAAPGVPPGRPSPGSSHAVGRRSRNAWSSDPGGTPAADREKASAEWRTSPRSSASATEDRVAGLALNAATQLAFPPVEQPHRSLGIAHLVGEVVRPSAVRIDRREVRPQRPAAGTASSPGSSRNARPVANCWQYAKAASPVLSPVRVRPKRRQVIADRASLNRRSSVPSLFRGHHTPGRSRQEDRPDSRRFLGEAPQWPAACRHNGLTIPLRVR